MYYGKMDPAGEIMGQLAHLCNHENVADEFSYDIHFGYQPWYTHMYRVDNKYGIFSGNAFTYTQTLETKNGYIVECTKGCKLFVFYM